MQARSGGHRTGGLRGNRQQPQCAGARRHGRQAQRGPEAGAVPGPQRRTCRSKEAGLRGRAPWLPPRATNVISPLPLVWSSLETRFSARTYGDQRTGISTGPSGPGASTRGRGRRQARRARCVRDRPTALGAHRAASRLRLSDPAPRITLVAPSPPSASSGICLERSLLLRSTCTPSWISQDSGLLL